MESEIEKKYIPLARYFQSATQNKIQLTFTELESIIGQKLPNASYLNKSWWLKTKSPLHHYLAWLDNGYQVTNVVPSFAVTFSRIVPYEDNVETHQLPYAIRTAELDDCRDLGELFMQLQQETIRYPYVCHRRHQSIQSLRKWMIDWKNTNSGQLFLAIANGEIAGYLLLEGYVDAPLKHRATLSMGVLSKYHRRGIGKNLFIRAEHWAKHHAILRFDVNVCARNIPAIALFESNGFVTEGRLKDAILVNDELEDELMMAKLFHL